jgi:C4-type Zn-finger protein
MEVQMNRRKEDNSKMKTVQGLLHQVVDYMTAAIGWIEMSDKAKAINHLRLAIGVLIEIQERLKRIMADLEVDVGSLGVEMPAPDVPSTITKKEGGENS